MGSGRGCSFCVGLALAPGSRWPACQAMTRRRRGEGDGYCAFLDCRQWRSDGSTRRHVTRPCLPPRKLHPSSSATYRCTANKRAQSRRGGGLRAPRASPAISRALANRGIAESPVDRGADSSGGLCLSPFESRHGLRRLGPWGGDGCTDAANAQADMAKFTRTTNVRAVQPTCDGWDLSNHWPSRLGPVPAILPSMLAGALRCCMDLLPPELRRRELRFWLRGSPTGNDCSMLDEQPSSSTSSNPPDCGRKSCCCYNGRVEATLALPVRGSALNSECLNVVDVMMNLRSCTSAIRTANVTVAM